MTSIIAQALDAYANSTSRTWSHDRLNTLGASEVGQCCRKMFWYKNEDDAKLRVPRDPEYVDTWGARMRGTVIEEAFWYPAMKARFGDRLIYAGPEQKTFVVDFLSATPDGMINDLTEEESKQIGVVTNCVMVECKSADPRTNLAEAKPANLFQTQVQMGIVRELHEFSYRPTHSVLSYIDASFWNEVREFAVPFDEKIYETAKNRATLVMTATDLKDLPPEGWIAGGRECNHCPFTKPCGVERRNLPFQDVGPPLDPQFVEEMTQLARYLKTIEGEQAGMETERRKLQDAIKKRLREKGVKKIPGVLSWAEIKGRQSYDNKAIKQAAIDAGIDVEKFSTVGDLSDRLTITLSE